MGQPEDRRNKLFEPIKSFSDLVDIMIRGLQKEWVTVSMLTYGMTIFTKDMHQVCAGCAATNTLCELMQAPFEITEVGELQSRAQRVNHGIEPVDLRRFEMSLNYLRVGAINHSIRMLGEIKHLLWFQLPDIDSVQPDNMLPELDDDNWKIDLSSYEEYRDMLKAKGL